MQVTLSKIEAEISRLSFAEQLELMEFLAKEVRSNSFPVKQTFGFDLAEMAEDSDMKREISEINAEFLTTEQDGLT